MAEMGSLLPATSKAFHWPVRVLSSTDAGHSKGDAKQNADRWDGPIETFAGASLEGADLIIDAVFGAGLTRDVSGLVAVVPQKAQTSGVPMVAVDIPSGVDGNTGGKGTRFPGGANGHILPQETSHLLLPGRDLCGEIVTRDIGIRPELLSKIKPSIVENGHVFGRATARPAWPRINIHVVISWSWGAMKWSEPRDWQPAARRVGAGLVSIAAAA